MKNLILFDFSNISDMKGWESVDDVVMGGRSASTIQWLENGCLSFRGEVSLENSGGFVQAALDVKGTSVVDASTYQGLMLEVYGNDEVYNLHLRTSDVWLPWQSYRASFKATAGWHRVRLPFAEFDGYLIGAPLNLKKLKRIGIVAIGRAFKADLCLASLALYRDTPPPQIR